MSRPRQKQLAAPVYVEIALPIPLRRTFTYRLGAQMRDVAQLGSRLIVPFGKRKLTGFAVEFYDELPADSGLEDSAIKDAIELVDEEPLITQEILKLTQWTADYYMASWGEVLKASLPAGIDPSVENFIKPKRRKSVRLISTLEDDTRLTPQQTRAVETLRQYGGEMLFTALQEGADVGGATINSLTRRKIVEIKVVEVLRDPLVDASLPKPDDFILSGEQSTALESIGDALS